MRVIIRADSTRHTGAGHVMRCWALAEELALRGWQVSWRGRIEAGWVLDALQRGGWMVTPPCSREDEDAAAIDADVVIVDSYLVSPEYRQLLLDRGIKVVAIVDDHHSDTGPGSLWVNPGVAVPWGSPYSDRFLNGPDFILLRREVRNLRAVRADRLLATEPPVVTFLLGGTDFENQVEFAAEVAGQLSGACQVKAAPAAETGNSRGVLWLAPGSGALREGALSDLVICPAGVTSWEMLFTGVPLGLLQLAENQRGNYEWMTRSGLAMPLGFAFNSGSLDDLVQSIQGILKYLPKENSHQSPIDGFGAARVAARMRAL